MVPSLLFLEGQSVVIYYSHKYVQKIARLDKGKIPCPSAAEWGVCLCRSYLNCKDSLDVPAPNLYNEDYKKRAEIQSILLFSA